MSKTIIPVLYYSAYNCTSCIITFIDKLSCNCMRSFEEKLTIKTSKSIFLKNVKKWEASTSWWNHFPLRWIYSSIRDCFVSQQLLFLFLLQSLQVFWKCDMLFANSLSPFLTMSSSFCKKSASFSWVFLFLMKQNKILSIIDVHASW